MNNTSPNLTEIGLIIISSLAIVGAVVLLFTGKIDYAGCAGLFGGVFVLWGGHTLYNAPSPVQQAQQTQQQAQLGAQQDTLQQIASQALAMLPVFAGLLHSHTAPPQGQQTPNALTPTMTPPVASVPTAANPGATSPALPQQAPMQQPGVLSAQTRDAWSNSALMQAIGKPPQTQQ